MASPMAGRILAHGSYTQRLLRHHTVLSAVPQCQAYRCISGSPSKGALVTEVASSYVNSDIFANSAFDMAHAPLVAAASSAKASENWWKGQEYFWQKIPKWENIGPLEFSTASFSSRNDVKLTKVPVKGGEARWNGSLEADLRAILPAAVPEYGQSGAVVAKEDVIQRVLNDAKRASMSVRVTPYIWSRINFSDPLNDPLFKQYVSVYSARLADHPALKLDSLNEKADSPVKGLVWRYPNKALLLLTDACPLYCQYCTRSYAVSSATDAVENKDSIKPAWPRIQEALDFVKKHPVIRDIVVSGGDASMVDATTLDRVCNELISMDNIRYFRVASRVLAVAPGRLLAEGDQWTNVLITAAEKARNAGKSLALHTHFQHPNEISDMTRAAARRLHMAGVIIRNQTVMIKGVNDTTEIQSQLIQELSSMQIQPVSHPTPLFEDAGSSTLCKPQKPYHLPVDEADTSGQYYVYQCDMVPGTEHFRTTLAHFNKVANEVQGSNAGFMTPKFIVDLPGGGGKRLGNSYETYNPETGLSTWKAPAIDRGDKKDQTYYYYDPVPLHVAKQALREQVVLKRAALASTPA